VTVNVSAVSDLDKTVPSKRMPATGYSGALQKAERGMATARDRIFIVGLSTNTEKQSSQS